MKMTLKIPDTLFRRAKHAAAERGITLSQFVNEVVSEKLGTASSYVDRPWMKSFGKLRRLHNETARINRLIEDEFEQIDAP